MVPPIVDESCPPKFKKALTEIQERLVAAGLENHQLQNMYTFVDETIEFYKNILRKENSICDKYILSTS